MTGVYGSGRWFPWVMAFTGMLVLLVSNRLTATALSVYDESLLNEFGWSRGELKFRDLVTFWLIALIAPFAGAFIDRLDSLAMHYAIHVILALGLLGLAGKLVNGALTDRIDRHKVFLICQAIMLVGVANLATLRKDLVLPSIAIVGLGWGGQDRRRARHLAHRRAVRPLRQLSAGVRVDPRTGAAGTAARHADPQRSPKSGDIRCFR